MSPSAGTGGQINLSQLQLDGVVFHLVPQRPTDPVQADQVAPSLSDAEQTLPDRLEQYLRDQIVSTFNRSRQRATPDPDTGSALPESIVAYLDSAGSEAERSDRFIALSKEAAVLLYERQRGNAPDGLLVVARGRIGARQVVCLAKLEQQSGLSFDVEVDGESQRVVVALEDGLVLTDETAVFKAAVFKLSGAKKLRSVDVIVSDEQSGKRFEAPISRYWLRAFLGCEYANDADVQTRSFVDAMKKVVNQDVPDLNDRDHLFDALRVELTNQNTSIDPQAFISANVPLDVQDKALKRLREAGAPTTAFPKGSEAIDRAPKNTWYEFGDGTRVKVPLDHEVEITQETSGGSDILTVRGRIVRIR